MKNLFCTVEDNPLPFLVVSPGFLQVVLLLLNSTNLLHFPLKLIQCQAIKDQISSNIT